MLGENRGSKNELILKGKNRPELKTTADMMRYLESIQELPTLSSVAMRVNSMLQNIHTTARDLAEVIEKDQSMVGKLLKLANSSFFGFSSRVSNVAHAVMILGFNTVFNAIISMAVIDALGVKNRSNGMEMDSFWRHSISVAVVSRYLCRGTGHQRPENAFTAGILHDIGKVVMARYFPAQLKEIWRKVSAEQISFLKAEQDYLPMGHDAIGAFLTRCWNLPDDLSSVVAQHHHPEILLHPNILALVTHTADVIVNLHLEKREPAEHWPISNAAKMLLGEKIRTVDQWLPAVAEEAKAACQSILD